MTWNFYDPLGALVPAVIQGLAGANSRTPAGGFADLRNAYAAANTGGAFDEFAHTADLRAGAQSFGWYNISHLGVFIWWLHSFPISGATPVASTGAGQPRPASPSIRAGGRFRCSRRARAPAASFGDDWVSPDRWQLPVAVRETLWNAYPDQLYPAAFCGRARWRRGAGAPLPREQVHDPSGDRAVQLRRSAAAGTIVTQYHFGFMSTIGAGGFPFALARNRRAAGDRHSRRRRRERPRTALAAISGDATVEIAELAHLSRPARQRSTSAPTPWR